MADESDDDEGCSCYDSTELVVEDQEKRLGHVSPSTALIESRLFELSVAVVEIVLC